MILSDIHFKLIQINCVSDTKQQLSFLMTNITEMLLLQHLQSGEAVLAIDLITCIKSFDALNYYSHEIITKVKYFVKRTC